MTRYSMDKGCDLVTAVGYSDENPCVLDMVPSQFLNTSFRFCHWTPEHNEQNGSFALMSGEEKLFCIYNPSLQTHLGYDFEPYGISRGV